MSQFWSVEFSQHEKSLECQSLVIFERVNIQKIMIHEIRWSIAEFQKRLSSAYDPILEKIPIVKSKNFYVELGSRTSETVLYNFVLSLLVKSEKEESESDPIKKLWLQIGHCHNFQHFKGSIDYFVNDMKIGSYFLDTSVEQTTQR